MKPTPPPEASHLFESPAAWSAWLAAHHASSSGLWLRLAKKASGSPTLTYAQALEVALCFGWIDGQRKPHDARFWVQRFTPRKAASLWSKINREKALALLAAGRMEAAGLAEIERAKADGRWEGAYDGASTSTVPADLQAALDMNPAAKAFFATLDRQNRYAVLFRIQTAKKAETRATRIQTFVAMLARHEKLHP